MKGKKALIGMIGQMVKSSERASTAIDKAVAFVEASNKGIDALERKIAK